MFLSAPKCSCTNVYTALLKRQSILREPSKGDTIAEMVSAQSRLVAKFSPDIAEALKTLEEQRAGKQFLEFGSWRLENGIIRMVRRL